MPRTEVTFPTTSPHLLRDAAAGQAPVLEGRGQMFMPLGASAGDRQAAE